MCVCLSVSLSVSVSFSSHLQFASIYISPLTPPCPRNLQLVVLLFLQLVLLLAASPVRYEGAKKAKTLTRLIAMASTLVALVAMASNLLALASEACLCNPLRIKAWSSCRREHCSQSIPQAGALTLGLPRRPLHPHRWSDCGSATPSYSLWRIDEQVSQPNKQHGQGPENRELHQPQR